MAQVLITLNLPESQELQQWLEKYNIDLKLRSMYDHWAEPLQPQLWALEGSFNEKIYNLLKDNFGIHLKSDIRFN